MRSGEAPSVRTRLTLIVGAAVAILLVGVLLVTVSVVNRSLTQSAHAELQNEAENLLHNYQLGGLKAVRQEIEVESLLARERPFYARVATEENKTLFSNIPRKWSALDFQRLEQLDPAALPEIFVLESAGQEWAVEIVTRRTSEGHVIQVGSSTKVRGDVIRIMATSVAIFAGPSLIVIVLLIVFTIRRVTAPIADITRTVRDVLRSGDLGAHVETSHAFRETNELVEMVNSLMGRVDRLVFHLRRTLDSLAHDIRTPMTRLQMHMELAASSETDMDALKAVMHDSLGDARQVVSLLQRFLEASEADSGAMALNRERVAVEELFEEVAEAYRLVAEEKGISLETSIDASGIVYIDPVRMRQAIGNLLDNAVKFSPAGSSVELSVQADSKMLEFSVKDNGPGVPAEQRSEIWSYQYRGPSGAHGYGLGLTIVRAVAEAHGGSAFLTTPAGGGSEFVLRMPRLKYSSSGQDQRDA